MKADELAEMAASCEDAYTFMVSVPCDGSDIKLTMGMTPAVAGGVSTKETASVAMAVVALSHLPITNLIDSLVREGIARAQAKVPAKQADPDATAAQPDIPLLSVNQATANGAMRNGVQ